MSRHVWNDIEMQVLRKFYADMPTAAIAAALKMPIGHVYAKAKALGLKKSERYLASGAAGRLDGSQGVHHRFVKGKQPWNTGTKGLAGQHPNSRRTQFQKGSMSGAAQHNYVPIGTTKINADGDWVRKVTDDPTIAPVRRWVAVRRLVWEAAHGPIAPGHMVAFKPGMKTAELDEITIDRLECISLAENMRRNTLHRYPQEITDAIRARAVLNRRINRVQKHQ